MGPAALFSPWECAISRSAHRYQDCTVSRIEPIRIPCQVTVRHIFMLAIFHHLVTSQVLDHPSSAAHDGFACREMAFVILSLATGDCSLDMVARYIGDHTRERSVGF